MRIFVGALAAFFAAALSVQAAPPPAEVYGRLPAISDVAISPDGGMLMVGIASGDIQGVRVVNLADGASLASARTPDGTKLRGVGWAEDQIAKFVISRTFTRSERTPLGYVDTNGALVREFFRVGTLALPEGSMQLLLADLDSAAVNSNLSYLFAPVASDPGFGRMFAWTKLTSDARYGIYRVDLRSGKGKLLSSYDSNTYGLLLDAGGNVAARTRLGTNSKEWHVYVRGGDGERLLRDENEDSGHSPIFRGLLPSGQLVRVDSPAGHDRDLVSYLNPSDNSEGIVLEDPKFDIDEVTTDPWTHNVIGAEWDADLGREQHFFEPAVEDAHALLKTALGNYPRITSWTRDRQKMIVFAQAADEAGTYYLFDAAAKKLARIGRTYPELPAANIGKVLSITYPARDGTKIPAYLTVPPGAEPKNLPLIVLVHGGPYSRDTADFDFWSQFLASRGYLVLQANYRGSSGYGDRWRVAGYKEWGGLMQRDVEDGAAALVAGGYADPARICIMGASYGGYAALAGATLTPNRYACAVSVAGLSDLLSLVQQERREFGKDHSDLKTIGDPDEDKAALQAASPLRHVADVRIPILLMHGTDDSVVPIEQTKMMVSALQNAHKDVRYVELAGDDHWLSRAATRTLMLAEIEKFLNEKMPATATEAPAKVSAKLPIPIVAFAGSAKLESGGTSHPAPDLIPKMPANQGTWN